MLPKCNYVSLNDDQSTSISVSNSLTMPSFLSQDAKSNTMVCSSKDSSNKSHHSLVRTFDFDLSSLPPSDTQENSPANEPPELTDTPKLEPMNGTGTSKKTDLRIELPTQPTLVVQSPKTPTLCRKLKAVSLDSDTNVANATADCLEVPRDTFSMPSTPKRQLPKTQAHKLTIRSHSGTSLGLDNSTSSNLSSFGSNQSISGSQTLKTLPEVMTLSDFSQGKTEPIRVRAKGLLERRGSNVSLTIDLCAAESKNTGNCRLNTAKSVSNLNLSNMISDKCSCNKTETKCECMPRRKDCKKCSGSLKRFQKLSTESCLCDENISNSICQGYKVCQYSRLGCLNYLSYMRRKSLSNENLYIGPSYEFRKVFKKSEYPKNLIGPQFKNQILSEDFQLHLQNIQYLQTAGNVLSKKQLRESCKLDHLKNLHKEFWELPQNFQEKSFVSGSQSKNRYKTILPNEHSRVILDLGNGHDSSGAEGYINANYIKGYDYAETAYIATQGPLSHTTGDLWHMVMQSNAQKVVMLTPIQEKGRIKCEMYFPEKLYEHITCGKFQVKCLHIHKEKSYSIRTLRVRDTTLIAEHGDQLRQPTTQTLDSPKYCCDKMKQCGIECKRLMKSHHQTISKNISDNVLNQFESNQNSPNHILSPLVKNNNCNNTNFFNENFEYLDVVGYEDEDDDIFTSMDYKPPTHRPRTQLRSRDFKFSDDFTDILNSAIPDSHDVCEDDEILETDRIVQHYWYQTWPDHNLANTEEILALALDVLDLRHEIECLYNEISRPSHFIRLNNSNKSSTTDVTTRSIHDKNHDDCQRNNLANDTQIPKDHQLLSQFKMHMDKNFTRQKPLKEKINVPIVVHCSAGIGRTGCFLAILNGIQQLKHNFNVDILAIVCALRLNRGGMVQTAEQYELIHKVLALYDEYIDK